MNFQQALKLVRLVQPKVPHEFILELQPPLPESLELLSLTYVTLGFLSCTLPEEHSYVFGYWLEMIVLCPDLS